MTFTTIFYQGGSANGEWKRASACATDAEARALAESIERAGRPAMVNRTEVWDAIGLPVGAPFWWDFTRLCAKVG